ncbi:MAG: hypothetical protein WDN48_05315 [Pseudolabrys sp.]
MVIDFRCRPPTDYFLQYFDAARVGWMAARLGAPQLSPSFLKGSMELFWEEMDEAGIDTGVVLGRNSPAVFMGKPFKEAFIPNEHIAELVAKYPKRLIGFGGIDASNQRHNAVEETVRCVEKLGLKGIFVEPGRQLLSHPADERLNPLYEACISPERSSRGDERPLCRRRHRRLSSDPDRPARDALPGLEDRAWPRRLALGGSDAGRRLQACQCLHLAGHLFLRARW